MTTTPDADAYQRLAAALAAHRGDAGAYARLGEQMKARRHLIDPRYGNRQLFVRERLVPAGLKESAAKKLAYDLENGKLQSRGGFSPGSMIILAQAYAAPTDAVIAVLDDPDADLGPLGGPPQQSPAPRLTSVPSGGGDEEAVAALLSGDGEDVPEVTAGIRAAMDIHIPGIRDLAEAGARAEAKRRGVPVTAVLREVPPGAAVFPGDAGSAALWDGWRDRGYLGLRFSTYQLIWGIAMRRVRDEVLAQQAINGVAG